MQIEPSIFKAYDIRGIYGYTLFEETAVLIGKAFTKVVPATEVIVGRDARVSSPVLHTKLIEGLTSVGVNVIDIGMVSTDIYYHACATRKLAGIMVTASHNPKEYNGFKMVRQIPYLLSGDEGIQDIRKVIEADDFPSEAEQKGIVTELNVMNEFIEKILSLVDHKTFKPVKIIADTANGMVGPSLEKIFAEIPQIELVKMYFEPDGTFPNHGGDPLIEENRKELQERVVAEKADLGIAFDPDGDRFFVIDRTGRFVSGDFMTAILSYYFLQKYPNSTIVYDIRASQAVPDTIKKYGGTPLYNRVGHAYIKKRMEENHAVFAGEVSGHYYFKDFYGCDSGVAPLMYLLDALAKAPITLEEVLKDYDERYYISGEINTKASRDPNEILAEIEQKYGSQAKEVIKIDGVTCIYEDWQFNVRISNTGEPLVRLNLESRKSHQDMEQKRDEVLSIIRK